MNIFLWKEAEAICGKEGVCVYGQVELRQDWKGVQLIELKTGRKQADTRLNGKRVYLYKCLQRDHFYGSANAKLARYERSTIDKLKKKIYI